LNERIRSGHFETTKARKALTKQGREIATKVTKSGIRGRWPRQGRGSRVGVGASSDGEREAVEIEGETANGFIHDVGTPANSLKRRSNSVSAKAATANCANRHPVS
jgi:hypothetical protein